MPSHFVGRSGELGHIFRTTGRMSSTATCFTTCCLMFGDNVASHTMNPSCSYSRVPSVSTAAKDILPPSTTRRTGRCFLRHGKNPPFFGAGCRLWIASRTRVGRPHLRCHTHSGCAQRSHPPGARNDRKPLGHCRHIGGARTSSSDRVRGRPNLHRSTTPKQFRPGPLSASVRHRV